MIVLSGPNFDEFPENLKIYIIAGFIQAEVGLKVTKPLLHTPLVLAQNKSATPTPPPPTDRSGPGLSADT